MYGWRARIGLISPTPGVDVVSEEIRRGAPDGVTFVYTRVHVPEVHVQGLGRFFDQLERATAELMWDDVDAVVQIGTPLGFFRGEEGRRAVEEVMRRVSNRPVATQMGAMVEAIQVLGGRRIALATAYVDELNVLMRAHLEECGFSVQGVATLDLLRNADIRLQGPAASYRLAKQAMERAPDADILVLSCGGLSTFDVLEAMEQDFQVPVVTSNQAALWKALRMLGIRERRAGYGRLLAAH